MVTTATNYEYPRKDFHVEIRNESLCALEKLVEQAFRKILLREDCMGSASYIFSYLEKY